MSAKLNALCSLRRSEVRFYSSSLFSVEAGFVFGCVHPHRAKLLLLAFCPMAFCCNIDANFVFGSVVVLRFPPFGLLSLDLGGLNLILCVGSVLCPGVCPVLGFVILASFVFGALSPSFRAFVAGNCPWVRSGLFDWSVVPCLGSGLVVSQSLNNIYWFHSL